MNTENNKLTINNNNDDLSIYQQKGGTENDEENLRTQKLKLKIMIRLILIIYSNLKRKQLQKKQSKDYQSIIEYYFDETLKENTLGNSVEMFFIKPYFDYLCSNSYDTACMNFKEKILHKDSSSKDDKDIKVDKLQDNIEKIKTAISSLSIENKYKKKLEMLLKDTDDKEAMGKQLDIMIDKIKKQAAEEKQEQESVLTTEDDNDKEITIGALQIIIDYLTKINANENLSIDSVLKDLKTNIIEKLDAKVAEIYEIGNNIK